MRAGVREEVLRERGKLQCGRQGTGREGSPSLND